MSRCTLWRSAVQRFFGPRRKPEGFSGAPIFADDRKVEPKSDPFCRIKPDPSDEDGLIYMLHILDLDKCGVLVKNVRNKSFSICM